MTDEPKKNHWYEMYELECLKTKKLEEQNTNLQEMLKAERSVTCKEEYLKRVTELEAQIEKMKCCGNCAKRGHICVAEEMQGNLCGKNKDKWGIKEIKEND